MAHEKITPIPGNHGDILLYLIKNVQKYFHLQLVLIISSQVVAASKLQILCFAFWFGDCLLRQPDKQRFLSNLNKTFPFLEQATHLLPLLGWHYFWQMQCNVSGVYLLHTNAHTITQMHTNKHWPITHTCTQTQTHIHTHTETHRHAHKHRHTHTNTCRPNWDYFHLDSAHSPLPKPDRGLGQTGSNNISAHPKKKIDRYYKSNIEHIKA